MKCFVVVPAAGSGSRFGGEVPKQFVSLSGRPLIAHTLSRFESFESVLEIIIPASRDQIERVESIVVDECLAKCRVIEGGATRAESVLAGLEMLSSSPDDSVVAIHDAVRPFVTRAMFDRLVAAMEEHDGAFPGVPVTDTIHVIDGRLVVDSPPRESLVGAQTPQLFRLGLVRRVLQEAERSGVRPTDEVSAVAMTGARVTVVEGDPSNLKITRPEDLEWAERFLAARRG